MRNKDYIPSLGFILLSVTLLSGSLVVKWALAPLSYEIAQTYEMKGHYYFKKKNYLKAHNFFLKSAEIKDNNDKRSYRYRCAGSALTEQKKYKESLKYFQESLLYNPDNIHAKKAIDWILSTNKIKYQRVKNDYSLNNIPLKKSSTTTFLSAGHLYGSPRWHGTLYPAPSIIENAMNFNKMEVDFFMGLGDIINGPTQKRLEIFDRTLIKKLSIPFYNSVGNHDISTRYKKYFKINNYYYSFVKEKNLFIILDTETIAGEIKEKQLIFLKNELAKGNNNKGIVNIFIFSHKLIWAYGLREKYSIVYNHVNAKTGYQENNNFYSLILPRLLENTKKIFWISGDIGVDWTLPAFYDEYNNKLTFIAVGLGDTNNDMLLKTIINKAGKVNFNLISLIDFPTVIDLKKYDIKYWGIYFGQHSEVSDFNYLNRYKDGWSKGKKGSVNIKIKKDAKYFLNFHTRNPKNDFFELKVMLDSILYKKIKFLSKQKGELEISLSKGFHTIDLSIDGTFNPKKLGISSDNRDLGIHFTLKKK